MRPRGTDTTNAEHVAVGEIISGTVVTASPDMSLTVLLDVMTRQGLSALPVTDADDRLVGLVTKSDVVRAQHELVELYGAAVGFEEDTTVRDVMVPVVYAVRDVASVARVAAVMVYEGLHRAPVLDGDGRLVGIVSLTDIALWLARAHGYQHNPDGWIEVRVDANVGAR
ncbi:MAG: CBS domain-containing protein [Myxococcales bacterium]|nr:CBS domain-containing protein [Myxococcales bacterium]